MALPRVRRLEPERLELDRAPAEPESQLEAAFGDEVHGGGILGEPQRMVQGRQENPG